MQLAGRLIDLSFMTSLKALPQCFFQELFHHHGSHSTSCSPGAPGQCWDVGSGKGTRRRGRKLCTETVSGKKTFVSSYLIEWLQEPH